jgi:UDP-glucose 4-epimerase
MSTADSLAGHSVLVVGGAGFVGSNLSQMLLSADVRSLTIVDNFLSSERSNIPDDRRVTLIEGSIADDAVLGRLPADLDLVWHLACYHGNQSSIHDPIADHDNNTITSLKLFQALSRRTNLLKVVYSAAGCAVAEKTFDAPAATPEDAPVSLFHDSPYSISKLVGEMYGNYFFKRHGMPFVKARFQNVYGPGEILGAGAWRGTPATVWRNVTPTFIWRALHQQALPLENEGRSGRDFIFVDDICRGLIACAVNGRAGEAYNLATGTEILIREWADVINELTGNPTPVDLLPARSWDTSGRRFGSTDKSLNELGFSAQVAYRDGLAKTIAWTNQNKELIERNVDKHHDELAAYEAAQASSRI